LAAVVVVVGIVKAHVVAASVSPAAVVPTAVVGGHRRPALVPVAATQIPGAPVL
jgi:hypothetical protein